MQLSALLGSEVLAGCFYRDYTANDLSADVHQKGGKGHLIPILITISHFTIDNFLGHPMGCAVDVPQVHPEIELLSPFAFANQLSASSLSRIRVVCYRGSLRLDIPKMLLGFYFLDTQLDASSLSLIWFPYPHFSSGICFCLLT